MDGMQQHNQDPGQKSKHTKRRNILFYFFGFVLVGDRLSFIIAVILLGAGTSMSRRQRYGKGWLDGECYLVKDGIFGGAAMLILLSLACTSASAVTHSRNKLQLSSSQEKPTKIVH